MMQLSRRSFLKGVALTAAGLLVPASALPVAEPQRRVWALDSSMLATARTTEEAQRFADAVARVCAEVARATEAYAKFGLLRPPSLDAIGELASALRIDLRHPDTRKHWPIISGRATASVRAQHIARRC